MFFKKKKISFDAKNSNEIKNAVNITCPSCSNEQSEPKMAFSTNCKQCGTYFKITDGKAVTPSDNTATVKTYKAPEKTEPTAEEKNNTQPELRIRKQSSLAEEEPEETEAVVETKKDPDKDADQKPKRYAPEKDVDKEPAPASFFGKNKPQTRDVACFDCDRTHQAPIGASAANCPQCGTYITLKDFDIRDQWNQRIQTRGDVTIHKKASVTGITIHCHHLLVHGQFTGGVNCSGDFTLNSHGKIMGTVNCKRLVIEKRANVEFSNHVYAEEVIIDGSVTGHFTCTGKLQLKKKATITGDIKVATMTMEEGAKHHGKMSIGQ